MRKQRGSPPEVTPRQTEQIITQVREYQLITPLFGGGVAPSAVDPITAIRGSEIRGQLRFWWRTCRGGQYSDLTTMKQAEDKIWGSASTKQGGGPSQVDIQVSKISTGGQKAPFSPTGRSLEDVAPGYAAFPLQPSDTDIRAQEPRKTVGINVSFTLTISFSVGLRPDIEAALWAWETFGGIGARTRRGFGALRLRSIDGQNNTDLPSSNTQQVVSWVVDKLVQFVGKGTPPAGVPHLSRALQFKAVFPSQHATDSWKELIKKLANFRQARNGRYGRSSWPEPEAIRQITQQGQHTGKFPRAAFGLPIKFHFKDAADPKDPTLQGAEKEKDRLASPLILRPLVCRDGRAVGIALLLEGSRIPPPGGIVLVEDNGQKHNVDAQLTPSEAKIIPVLNGEQDVLKAFMNYL